MFFEIVLFFVLEILGIIFELEGCVFELLFLKWLLNLILEVSIVKFIVFVVEDKFIILVVESVLLSWYGGFL